MNKKLCWMRVCTALGLFWFCALSFATDMQVLNDEALSDVRGGDGLSLLLNLNTIIGSSTIGLSDSAGNPATLSMNNLVLTGPIAATVDLSAGASGSPDFVGVAFPNVGANNLQISYGLAITANGSTLGTGIALQNFGFGGSNMQWTPAATTDGFTFGLGLNLAIGNVLLQPNGVGNSSGQMSLSGIQIGAAGNATAPWVLADVAAQPGIFSVNTDASGNQYVQVGIGWPTGQNVAASGSLQINNVTFTTPTGNVNLGNSSIGSMQIQYLNVKFKP